MSDDGEGDFWVSHKPIVQSMTEATQEMDRNSSDKDFQSISPENLVGTTFLHQPEDDRQILHAQIVQLF